jgi:hypothetical protein
MRTAAMREWFLSLGPLVVVIYFVARPSHFEFLLFSALRWLQ